MTRGKIVRALLTGVMLLASASLSTPCSVWADEEYDVVRDYSAYEQTEEQAEDSGLASADNGMEKPAESLVPHDEAASSDSPSSTPSPQALGRWHLDALQANDGVVGQSIAVSAQVSGESASSVSFNFGYCFEGKFVDWSSVLKATGKLTDSLSWSFVPSKAGTYTIFVDAVGPDGLEETRQTTVQVSSGWSLDGVRSDLSSVELGQQVVVTPVVSGTNSGNVLFNYVWCYESGFSEWSSTVKETGSYSSEKTWSFTPEKAGKYVLYVDATFGGRTITKSIDIDVIANWHVEGISLSNNGEKVGDTIQFGDQPTITVDFTEGSNVTGITYNYIWRYGNGWSEWGSLKSQGKLSNDPSYQYSLKKAGKYTLYVDVIGTDGRTETFSTTVEIVLPYSVNGILVSKGSVVFGDSVVVKPSISGDANGVRYNFGYCYEGKFGDWNSTVKNTGDYTSQSSWEFTPNKSGKYTLFVDVIGLDGSKATFQRSVSVDKGWSSSNLSIVQAGSYKVGKAVGINFAVTGSRANRVQYNFVWQRDGWSDWSSNLKESGKRSQSPNSSFVPTHSGNYTFYFDCYDLDTGQTFTVSGPTIHVDKKWSLSKLSLSYSTPIHPGDGVVGTAVVSGDASGLKYNFIWQRDNWMEWNSSVRSGSYSSQKTMNWSPIASSGTYSFYVDVVDQNGEKETVGVSGIKVVTSSDVINSIVSTLAGEKVNKSSYGYKYENAIVAAGGQLCAGRHGKWCAAYLWWGFDRAGYRSLWGTSLTHVQSDPEYLAWEYQGIGRYHAGTSGIKRGDLLFMRHTPWRAGQNITHVGLVTSVTSTSITVIEGNMGWGPYHTYPRYMAKFIGYARPKY